MTMTRERIASERNGGPALRSCAAVWIDEGRALVARRGVTAAVMTWTLERASDPESRWLATVVRAIGDTERVAILGPDDARLSLEREYVSIFKRPDRLVDVDIAGPLDLEDLVARVDELAG
jgi:hypothetical protein